MKNILLVALLFLSQILLVSGGDEKKFLQKQKAKDDADWVSLEEGESLGVYTRVGDRIYCYGAEDCEKPFRGVDISTFKVSLKSNYAKDKDRVYYPLIVGCADGEVCSMTFCPEYEIEGVDPQSFRYLDKDYAVDNKSAYFRGEKIAGSDGQTFSVVQGPCNFYFAKDKSYVYKHGSLFPDADSETFYYDQDDKRTIAIEDEWLHQHVYIIGDKNTEWRFTPPNGIKKVRKK